MSDLSIYYDAEEDWIDENDIVEFEEITPPVPIAEEPLVQPGHREEIQTLLQAVFNINHFLPNQYEAIDAAMNGNDIFLVFPKGEQRNICYQIPVLYHFPKLTNIVIVPDSLYLLQQDDHNLSVHNIPTLFCLAQEI
ncbi:hypothetical protein INT47_008233 [Mucor saturninus]|uniref:Uncharacterized protein n=1 Tax=Mucor saturninus TaxID=64648 RepID=A0A8H7R5F9_9FUNG|nr:hypothetical protein INT47_008233 [Mucor saturninus]